MAQRENLVTAQDMAAQPRIWLGARDAANQTRLFRRMFSVPSAVTQAHICVYAEGVYHVWVNGKYVGRGPIFHHPTHLPYDRYEVSQHLRVGPNVIAVLVHAPGIGLHNAVPTGEPGLTARVVCELDNGSKVEVGTDEQWRVTDRTGWRSDTPKRNWAIGFTECFEVANAPGDWQAVGFDDGAWAKAEVNRPATTVAGAEWVEREVPDLTYRFEAPKGMFGLFGISAAAAAMNAPGTNLGRNIMEAAWLAPDRGLKVTGANEEGWKVEGLREDRGAIVCFDMGEEYVGQVLLECECPTAGVIDVGWSEVAENGKVLLVRKGVSYVDRVVAAKGQVKWAPINFSGMRYVVITLRGFTGTVVIRKVGVRATEPDVKWVASFASSDERIDGIWRMCERSLRVGTQEGMMDCPTREQSPYVGDGQWTGRWFSQLTGDLRHWRYLVREQFRRQSEAGLIRPSVFTAGSDTLMDYTLVGVIGTRDYWLLSRDMETVKEVLPACRKALGWFTSQFDDRGVYVLNWQTWPNTREWENRYNPTWPKLESSDQLNLFIDHPGMGWHNVGEAGMDRRGTNAAINMTIALTQRALADLEEVAGDTERSTELRKQADSLAATCGRLFFDSERGVFVDGILDGKQLTQVSEQTNTLAVAAGCCDRPTATAILEKILKSDDLTIARNGPYFWAYLFPCLAELGLSRLALGKTSVLWGNMIDHGASTLWETFRGDDKDTWCHPWSGAPVEFCLTGVLGLPGIECPAANPVLRPRFDLMAKASGSCFTRLGLMKMEWKRGAGNAVELAGELPAGVSATVVDPAGKTLGTVSGKWRLAQLPPLRD